MDCDFFEHSYFFTQPRSQGESTSEDLSWLIYLLTNGRDPKDVIFIDDVPKRYKLPPRSTQGIPPRRYDLEFESQRYRYPIYQENQDHLSQTALAFNASLYSCNLPKNTDDALRGPKWKKTMEEEIIALKKNETWE